VVKQEKKNDSVFHEERVDHLKFLPKKNQTRFRNGELFFNETIVTLIFYRVSKQL